MKLTIAIPVMGHIQETKGCWGSLIESVADKENTELLIINNNSQDDTVNFLNRFVFPHFPKHILVNNPENVGMIESLNQSYHSSTGDIIACLHNDVYIYERGWDLKVLDQFEEVPETGMVGFFGAQGIEHDGGRCNCYTNMLEAEVHGTRSLSAVRVVAFDGFSLICSRKMLDRVGGFDRNYTYHHFYDKDISLESHTHGFYNVMLPIFCHHVSGQTATQKDYQNWISDKMGVQNGEGDNASYLKSEQYFLNKWNLPIKLNT